MTLIRTSTERRASALGWRLLACLVAGVLGVFAFAPLGIAPLALLSLGVLVWALRDEVFQGRAFLLGLLWGIGQFAAGVGWLYVALHEHGGLAAPLAALAILLFATYLALYPALAALAFVRLRSGGAARQMLLFAAVWALGEWLRGTVFTGFPWLAVGYTQTPPSPLAGFFPLIGVYGVSALLAAATAALVLLPWRRSVTVVLALTVSGALLGLLRWTEPVGEPLRVALIQTNIPQSVKWEPRRLGDVLDINRDLVAQYDADLLVLPETTLPMLIDRLPTGYLDSLDAIVRDKQAELVIGLFVRDEAGRIYNAAQRIGAADDGFYAKQHLVPFGEYAPPLFEWFFRLVAIPMANQTPGAPDQPPFAIGGQRVAVNICYEDVFGAELLPGARDATVLLNISNLAWYGDSFAQPQHLQMARARALETGRPMLRSTNTGMTGVVAPDGSVQDVLPGFTRGAVVTSVQGTQGLTPYARTGDVPVLLALAGVFALGVWQRRRVMPGA